MEILAIDPGLKGALVWLTKNEMHWHKMPLNVEKGIDFFEIQDILELYPKAHVFLERAHPGAMGVTGAFNYGRGFAALEIAILIAKRPVTYIEPAKWAKVMHEGISNDLKPKVKSEIALKRLFPQYLDQIPKGPKNGKIDEGVMDALLIAGYGLRAGAKK